MARYYRITYRLPDGSDDTVDAQGNTRRSAARYGRWKLPKSVASKAIVVSVEPIPAKEKR